VLEGDLRLADSLCIGKQPLAVEIGQCAGDDEGVRAAATDIGYIHPDDSPERARGVVDLIRLTCEPFAHRGPDDFAASGMIGRARDLALSVAMKQGLRSPPPQTIFLHRKLLGTFLICSRLRARVNVHALIERHV